MAVLEVQGVTRRFGERAAVADITFNVEPGEVYGFLGPNGAGKTTTIRIILGLVRPSSGRVLVNGADSTSQHATFWSPSSKSGGGCAHLSKR